MVVERQRRPRVARAGVLDRPARLARSPTARADDRRRPARASLRRNCSRARRGDHLDGQLRHPLRAAQRRGRSARARRRRVVRRRRRALGARRNRLHRARRALERGARQSRAARREARRVRDCRAVRRDGGRRRARARRRSRRARILARPERRLAHAVPAGSRVLSLARSHPEGIRREGYDARSRAASRGTGWR